jgi:hypothetical protein
MDQDTEQAEHIVGGTVKKSEHQEVEFVEASWRLAKNIQLQEE